MSRILSTLLQAEEPLFSIALTELEQASGHPGVDIRLTAEISAKIRQKTKELGLDPEDTPGVELYYALQGLIGLHDQYLAKVIGTDVNAELHVQLAAIVSTLKSLPLNRSCWVMKHAVAKKLLKNHPPKRVMKQLGYKSVDSLLKREPVSEIMAATRFCETSAWQAKLIKSYQKLLPGDFEIRDIEVLLLNDAKWKGSADDYIYRQRHNITHLKELGVIVVLPIPVRRLKGVVITVLPLALHYINEIRSYSSLLKMQQVRPNFGEVLVRTILDDSADFIHVAGQQLHWRVVQRYFGAHKKVQPELFEPHVQIEDLHWRKAEDVLYHIEPALNFWNELDYVGVMSDGKPLSFNLMDNAVNYCNGLEYGNHTARHLHEALWNEIYMRYLGQESLEKHIVEQLNDRLISEEDMDLEL